MAQNHVQDSKGKGRFPCAVHHFYLYDVHYSRRGYLGGSYLYDVHYSRRGYLGECENSIGTVKSVEVAQGVFQNGKGVNTERTRCLRKYLAEREPSQKLTFDFSTLIAVEKTSAEKRKLPCAHSTLLRYQVSLCDGNKHKAVNNIAKMRWGSRFIEKT